MEATGELSRYAKALFCDGPDVGNALRRGMVGMRCTVVISDNGSPFANTEGANSQYGTALPKP